MIGEHEKSIQYYERAMQLSPLDMMGIRIICGHFGSVLFPGSLRSSPPLGRTGAPGEAALPSSSDDEDSCIGDGRLPSRRTTGHGSATEALCSACSIAADHAAFGRFPTRRSRALRNGAAQGGISRLSRPPPRCRRCGGICSAMTSRRLDRSRAKREKVSPRGPGVYRERSGRPGRDDGMCSSRLGRLDGQGNRFQRREVESPGGAVDIEAHDIAFGVEIDHRVRPRPRGSPFPEFP